MRELLVLLVFTGAACDGNTNATSEEPPGVILYSASGEYAAADITFTTLRRLRKQESAYYLSDGVLSTGERARTERLRSSAPFCALDIGADLEQGQELTVHQSRDQVETFSLGAGNTDLEKVVLSFSFAGELMTDLRCFIDAETETFTTHQLTNVLAPYLTVGTRSPL